MERLQKARNESTDSGTQERIDAWIEEQKRKLVSEDSPNVPASRRLAPMKCIKLNSHRNRQHVFWLCS
jgi:hypothetical protein